LIVGDSFSDTRAQLLALMPLFVVDYEVVEEVHGKITLFVFRAKLDKQPLAPAVDAAHKPYLLIPFRKVFLVDTDSIQRGRIM
jgi:hypothetical protein